MYTINLLQISNLRYQVGFTFAFLVETTQDLLQLFPKTPTLCSAYEGTEDQEMKPIPIVWLVLFLLFF